MKQRHRLFETFVPLFLNFSHAFLKKKFTRCENIDIYVSLRSPAPRWSQKRAPPPLVCDALPPLCPACAYAWSVVRVAFKGAKGASVAGCPCVRVPVRACMRVRVCICAGVACVRDGVRADGAGNDRAGRAGGRCVPVPGVSVRVGVGVIVCVRV